MSARIEKDQGISPDLDQDPDLTKEGLGVTRKIYKLSTLTFNFRRSRSPRRRYGERRSRSRGGGDRRRERGDSK